jgi:hypothetical protein
MPETGEILGLIAGLLMAVLVVAPRWPSERRLAVRWMRRPALGSVAAAMSAMALIAVLWGALVTVSAENDFDPEHRLNAALAQAAPAR